VELRASDIEVSGGQLSVLSVGEGPAVMFLHGWALDQRMWRQQYALAEKGLRVVTMDRRGFGASSAPPDLAQETDDITRVLDALSLDRATLVGMSQGGRIALRYATASPERLSHLVLQGAPIDGFPTAPTNAEAVPIARFREYLSKGEKVAFLHEWLQHPLMHHDRALAGEVIEELAQGYSGRDLLQVVPDHYTTNVFASLESMVLPSLYVVGEYDTGWLKTVAETFEKLAPNGHAVSVPGAGHLCNVTRPDFYNNLLLDLLMPQAL
jgi:pimeloyl-ACP methyl ester carboxylesterase